VPTTRRVFRGDDPVSVFMQVYQGTRRTDDLAPVSVRTRMLDARGAAVRDESVMVAASDFIERRADWRADVPLAGLARGEYLMQLDATAGRQTVRRAVRLTIE
jgi:hypothetical protein